MLKRGTANKLAREDISRRVAGITVKQCYVHPNEDDWIVEFSDGSKAYGTSDQLNETGGLNNIVGTNEQKRAAIKAEIWDWGFAPITREMMKELETRGVSPISDQEFESWYNNYEYMATGRESEPQV